MQDMLGADDEGFAEVEDSALVEAGLEALDERERLSSSCASSRG